MDFVILADIAKIPWTESNIESLRASAKAEVVRFLNGFGGGGVERIMPAENVTELALS